MPKRFFNAVTSRLTPTTVVTFLILATAAMLLAAQFTYARYPERQFGPLSQDQFVKLSLLRLHNRVERLQLRTDPIEREKICLPLSSFARQLDRTIPEDARIFVNGVLGKDLGTRMSMYLFLRNYLFPREVEISLDGNAYLINGGFEGVSCDSREELRVRGFDVLIDLKTNNATVIAPLTEKGKLK